MGLRDRHSGAQSAADESPCSSSHHPPAHHSPQSRKVPGWHRSATGFRIQCVLLCLCIQASCSPSALSDSWLETNPINCVCKGLAESCSGNLNRCCHALRQVMQPAAARNLHLQGSSSAHSLDPLEQCANDPQPPFTYGKIRMPSLKVEAILKSQRPRHNADVTIITQCSVDRQACNHAMPAALQDRHAFVHSFCC